MPRTLVESDKSGVTISIMNISSTHVKLNKNTWIGTLQPVDRIIEDPLPLKGPALSVENELPNHLKPLIENSSPALTTKQTHELTELLTRYQDVFMGPDGKLGRTDIVKHTIHTGDAAPIKLPPRRVAHSQQTVIEQEVHNMLEMTSLSQVPVLGPLLSF